MKKIAINIVSVVFIILTILSTFSITSAKQIEDKKGFTICCGSDGTYYACLENASTWDCGGTPPCE